MQITVSTDEHTQKVYSFEEILKENGIYVPLEEKNVRIIITDNIKLYTNLRNGFVKELNVNNIPNQERTYYKQQGKLVLTFE